MVENLEESLKPNFWERKIPAIGTINYLNRSEKFIKELRDSDSYRSAILSRNSAYEDLSMRDMVAYCALGTAVAVGIVVSSIFKNSP